MFQNDDVFVHKLADVKSSQLGQGTKIWQFTIILEGAVIGENCTICSHCFVENDVIIGDNVTIKNGVFLWDGIRIEDKVFIGPNATFTNDKYPVSKNHEYRQYQTIIKRGASIGAGACVLPGVVIGENSVVGAGAVVTKNVPNDACVVGNPAMPIRKCEC